MKTEDFEVMTVYLNTSDYNSVIDTLLNKMRNQKELSKEEYLYLSLAYILNDQIESFQSLWIALSLEMSQNEIDIWIEDLVGFLEEKVTEFLQQEKLEDAKTLYESLLAIHPGYENRDLLEKLIDAIYSLASNLSFINKFENAIEVYQAILRLEPDYSLAWHSLALCYYNLEQYDEAEKSINKALELDQDVAQNHYALGLILEKQEKYNEAIRVHQQAITNDPTYVEGYKRIGDLYLGQNFPEKAIEIYEIALRHIPKNSFIFENLGNIYQLIGDHVEASYHLGYSAYFSEKTGCLYIALNYFEEVYKNKDKKNLNFYFYGAMANCYAMCNQTQNAIILLEEAMILFPEKQFTLKRIYQCTLPVLYKNKEEINFYRQRFQSLLEEIIQFTDPKTPEEKQDVLESITTKTNFYLGYQDRNDMQIQKRYGSYVYGIMQKAFPQWCKTISIRLPREKRKIRVGLISYRLEGLGILYLGWLKYLDKCRFEFFIYNVVQDKNQTLSGLKSEFKEHCQQFRFIPQSIHHNELCETILNDELDVFIIPDLGMDTILTFLSYLRLAPIQCTTWGHPITSGSPTIDYFLSSDLMEPSNAEDHYSEKLVRLPNLAFSIPSFSIPELAKSRTDFQLKEESVIYWCSQSLFKYLPQHDYIFPVIATRNPHSQFVFVDPLHGRVITEVFQERLNKAFQEFSLDYQQYCTFLPRLNRADFVAMNQVADVFLDCLSWSGGLTTRDAIVCGLPVVTRPGEFMRGRHSYAILKMIGLTETIAETEEEYIDIAVRLGLDLDWRHAIQEKILANRNRLFDDQICIRGLEAFLEKAVQELVVTTG